jgi:hypothetical protein
MTFGKLTEHTFIGVEDEQFRVGAQMIIGLDGEFQTGEGVECAIYRVRLDFGSCHTRNDKTVLRSRESRLVSIGLDMKAVLLTLALAGVGCRRRLLPLLGRLR